MRASAGEEREIEVRASEGESRDQRLNEKLRGTKTRDRYRKIPGEKLK
jgi:hypothetical protein